jgi:hypothetical protein
MKQLHPILSIGNSYDISLKRFDQVFIIITQIILCAVTCYFFLQDKLLSSLAFEDLFVSEEINLTKAVLIGSILLLPLPSNLYDSCRIKYRIKNRVISEEY